MHTTYVVRWLSCVAVAVADVGLWRGEGNPQTTILLFLLGGARGSDSEPSIKDCPANRSGQLGKLAVSPGPASSVRTANWTGAALVRSACALRLCVFLFCFYLLYSIWPPPVRIDLLLSLLLLFFIFFSSCPLLEVSHASTSAQEREQARGPLACPDKVDPQCRKAAWVDGSLESAPGTNASVCISFFFSFLFFSFFFFLPTMGRSMDGWTAQAPDGRRKGHIARRNTATRGRRTGVVALAGGGLTRLKLDPSAGKHSSASPDISVPFGLEPATYIDIFPVGEGKPFPPARCLCAWLPACCCCCCCCPPGSLFRSKAAATPDQAVACSLSLFLRKLGG